MPANIARMARSYTALIELVQGFRHPLKPHQPGGGGWGWFPGVAGLMLRAFARAPAIAGHRQ